MSLSAVNQSEPVLRLWAWWRLMAKLC